MSVGIAIVGTGFVADFYLATMPNHPELNVVGAFDRDPGRLATFAAHHGVARYPSLDALLDDERVDIVVNLTSPQSHFEVSRAALLAGRHVYSEKPLAVTGTGAEQLVLLAEQRGLVLGCAPCSLLGEAAQTVWRAIRRGEIGTPQLVYAELDDGALHRMAYQTWKSVSGAPWPYRSELETGCVREHAGYYLSWLTAFFGPIAEVTAFSINIVPEVPDVQRPAPDFASACISFRTGVVARLTCSIIAPPDRSLRVVGDEGVLYLADAWDYGSAIHIRRARPPGTPRRLALADPVAYPLVRPCKLRARYEGSHTMDFARGIAEVAHAALDGRPSRLSARHALTAVEVMEAMVDGGHRRFTNSLEPVAPMEWAVD